MTERFAILPFAPAHLAAISDLWVATWAKTMPDIDFEARRPWFHGHLDTLQAGGAEVHVAQANGGEVAGFVAIHPGTGYLDQLAVAPAFWGKGAAEALMDTAKARASGGIQLDVNQDNPRAIAFYERLGLKIVAAATNPASGRAIWRMAWRPG
ncbi:GNAT family N-acetyltransferase [Aquabacter cavernae]|uniref:GNAT family N-acetyltransferase n=1 Tax=Aquabacter cavernae TaxID=2496029 RepID=UPI000F8F0C94|nr:GNAT family N-acetyltransferase [Aquabacter cavernae]